VDKNKLSKPERDFLNKITPLAITISQWTRDKAYFLKVPIKHSIYPSIIIADIIIESNWGTHPLAQPQYNKRYSNNLTLSEVDEIWEGKIQRYAKKEYKAFQDWAHFATDYSDRLIFSHKYKSLFNTSDYKKQIESLSKYKPEPRHFAAKCETLLDFYFLFEMDR